MKFKQTFLAVGLAFTASLQAAPWVEVNDLAVRADIQLLNDSGAINLPATTYPLMWSSVNTQLSSIDTQSLNDNQLAAYTHLRRHIQKQTAPQLTTKVRAYLSNSNRRFSSFGDSLYEKGSVSASAEKVGTNWAGRLQVNYRSGFDKINEGDTAHLDGSYIAYRLGNWVMDVSAKPKWWGPGVDSSLILSNNARPLPAIAISRDNSEAFESPWLSWIGPWTFTAQMAQLEQNRVIANAKLWSTRAAFRPVAGLDIGFAWSYQWGGKGQPNSFEQFYRGLFGETECVNGAATCDESLQTKLGNQLAGYDVRWGDSIDGTPYALYAQTIGEDSPEPGTLRISDKGFLYGLELQLNWFESRLLANLEYSDTQANCGPRGDTSQDCYYEHGTYQSGYRYYRRSIGSTYDNDAETIVLTLFGQRLNGDTWQIKVRDLTLNSNDRDRFASDVNLGNTVSQFLQNVKQLDLQYTFPWHKSQLTLGGFFSQTDNHDNTGESNSEVSLYVNYEYRWE